MGRGQGARLCPLLVLPLTIAALAVGGGGSAIAATCPNDQFRTGYGSSLPDCRAYEQATPVDKNGGDVITGLNLSQASRGGDAVTFFSNAGIPGGVGAQDYPFYVARRGSAQWASQGLYPPASMGPRASVIGWSPDLTASFAEVGGLDGTGRALLRRDSSNGSLETMVPPPPTPEGSYFLAGASSDGSRVVFETTAQLTPGAATGFRPNVYLWDMATGEILLVSALNDEQTPPAGAFAGPYAWFSQFTGAGGPSSNYFTIDTNAVSADGSRVFFTASDSGRLFLRENPTATQSGVEEGSCAEPALACTVEVSASRKENGSGPGGSDPNGPRPAEFMGGTDDGSKVFFTSSEELTDDANTGPPPTIARAELDGTAPDLEFIPAGAGGVAVDGAHLYWTNIREDAIGRANLDGTGVEPSFITGADNPRGVAVDAAHVYWTNAATGANGAGTIGRANLDGTAPNQAFITGFDNPQGIAVNATHIYWANSSARLTFRRIGRANLDGTGVEPRFINSGNVSVPRGVALDATHVYWADMRSGAIGRANLDGTGVDTFFISGADGPQGVAVNGSHVYWGNAGAIGRANLDGTGADQGFIAGTAGGTGVAVDAGHVYWSDNAGNPGKDLYRYDVVTDELIDLTVNGAVNGAEVAGVVGMSEDGSDLYFVANGVLAPGASPGNCALFGIGGGTCNLYHRHNGTTTFIATLDNEEFVGSASTYDGANWQPSISAGSSSAPKAARVTPDGDVLLFRSRRKLTEYDNQGQPQFYRYEAGGEVVCVSCNPGGAPPSGPATLQTDLSIITSGSPASTLTRNLSADGNRIFFETPDPLVATDTNGITDVYEWEANGAGSCESASQNGGCLHLLSTGRDPDGSYFVDASATGDDVFVRTRQQLVGQDRDQLGDVYTVRVGGGLASQSPVPPPICLGEACRDRPAVPPGAQVPGSSAFVGPPNPGSRGDKKKRRRCGRKGRRRSGKAKHGKTMARCGKKSKKRQKRSKHRQGRRQR